MGRKKLHCDAKDRVQGKLCSDPRINNSDIYVAFYQGGYTIGEIAAMFGKPDPSVRTSIKYHTSQQAREARLSRAQRRYNQLTEKDKKEIEQVRRIKRALQIKRLAELSRLKNEEEHYRYQERLERYYPDLA